jgi:hypothetical protein
MDLNEYGLMKVFFERMGLNKISSRLCAQKWNSLTKKKFNNKNKFNRRVQ